jgi:hypothetical protein
MRHCQNCGNQSSETDRFCKTCGAPITSSGTLPVVPTQSYSSTQQGKRGKSKVVSILLAVFLPPGYWAWLYTYKRNWWKFWLGLILSGLPSLLAAVFLVFYISNVSWLPDNVIIALAYILPFMVWAWAIIDSIIKKNEWYAQY